MYTHCLFCAGSLGANAALEHFPVGSRLAFDAKRGRLWVVCPHCERWCLTPLEERWEAIEEAERLFEKTPRRASSTHIGLARTSDGTTLVRIGEPTKLEFAAWRYGDQFGRRRRRNLLVAGGAAAAFGAVFFGGPALGMYTAGSLTAANLLLQGGNWWTHTRRTVARLKVPERVPVPDIPPMAAPSDALVPNVGEGGGERTIRVTPNLLRRSRIFTHPEHGWVFSVLHRVDGVWWNPATGLNYATDIVELTGEHARRAAAVLLPHVNRYAGSRGSIDDAVRVLEAKRTSDAIFSAAAQVAQDVAIGTSSMRVRKLSGTLPTIPEPIRLALEMSVHEERERAALEGELAELERAWRDAEEIAAIADDLLPNPSVTTRLSRLLSG